MYLLPARTLTAIDCIHHADAFALLRALPAASIDLCLSDTPYGTTACAWDTVIDLAAWWREMARVMKPRGAVVMTASQPYTSVLVMSNLKWFRYEWIWDRHSVSGYLSANIKPLKRHESILVFCDAGAPYFPQMEKGERYRKTHRKNTVIYNTHSRLDTINEGERYPVSVISGFPSQQEREHPTQKPIGLFEYLIRTYTRFGELVLDPFIGSGTTALAARNAGRHYIGGDLNAEYVAIARRRLAQPYTLPMFDAPSAGEISEVVEQQSMFGD